MKGNGSKRTIAAFMSLVIAGGVMIPAGSGSLLANVFVAEAAGSTASLDTATGVLTISGNVKASDVSVYRSDERVKKVVCAEGTVFPADCSYLFHRLEAESIDLSNADTSKVTNMDGMLSVCEKTTSIDVSSFNTSKVTNMHGLFYDCYRLRSIDVSSFDTSKVTDMSGMFGLCKALTTIDITNFDTSKVEDMSYMFDFCKNLAAVYVSDKWSTASVIDSESMFDTCDTLFGAYYAGYVDVTIAHSGKGGALTNIYDEPVSFETGSIIDLDPRGYFESDDQEGTVEMIEGGKKLIYDGYNTKYDQYFFRIGDTPVYISSENKGDPWGIALIGGIGTQEQPYKLGVVLGKPAPEFLTNSMTLGGSIALNFYINLDAVPEDNRNSCYVVFDYNGQTSRAMFDPDKMNKTKTGYGFSCRLNSVSMADDVKATLCYKDKYGIDRKLSAVTNCENYMKKVNESHGAVLWNLIKNINDFGYYMQQYLSVYSASPWTIGVDHKAMEKAYATHKQYQNNKNTYLNELKNMKKTWGTNQNIDKVNYSLVLESDTAINFKIKKKAGYTGKFIVKLDGKEVTPVQLSDGRYQVTASGIPAHLLSEPHTVTVTTNSGTTTYKASVLSYAYECMGVTKIDSEFDAMCALYEYYKATIAYKNN